MFKQRQWAGRTGLLATAAIMVLAATPALAVPESRPPDPSAPAPVLPTVVNSTALPALGIADKVGAKDTATYRVFIHLSGTPAVDLAAQGVEAVNQTRAAAAAQAASVLQQARTVHPEATELFEVSNAVRGLGVATTAAALNVLAARDDVLSIKQLVTKRPSSTDVTELTGALATWQRTGYDGSGVRIGIIDTGVDYTHANFGGPGTKHAGQAARAAAALTWTPTRKVAGGHDFVGDAYDPGNPAANVPQPDSNPMDCTGHGSAVASAAAGFGVTADGSTYQGGYPGLDTAKLARLRIPPGTAPGATIYALKVFGCAGVTDTLIPALDWALDPDGDGDFRDRLDLVTIAAAANDHTVTDDPDLLVLDKVAREGVLPVLAAGNGGDVLSPSGSLATATRALTVASSRDGVQRLDGLTVTAPAPARGMVAGQFSLAYPWSSSQPVSGPVTALTGANADGCQALSPGEVAAVSKKIAYLTWDEDDATRRCGSDTRSAHIAAAGGVGVILGSDQVVFNSGTLGSPDIPVIRLTAAASNQLAGPLAAGSLTVTFDPAAAAMVVDAQPTITDTASTFTARFATLGHTVKPDLTAPGDSAVAAALGSGNRASAWSGTSIAAGTAAGIAALVRQAHPAWSVQQLKASLVNTANHDVRVRDRVLDVQRAGAGRIDAAATKSQLLGYVTETPGAVGVAFGDLTLAVNEPARTISRTVAVQNTTDSAQTVTANYREMVGQPGVHLAISPQTLTIQPGRTETITVTMTAQPGELGRADNPALRSQVPNPLTGQSGSTGAPVGYSGLVLLTSEVAEIRVPVTGAARAGSATTAEVRTDGTVVQSGAGLSQPTRSQVAVLALGAVGEPAAGCQKSPRPGCAGTDGDLKQAGVGAGNGAVWFGLVTARPPAPVGTATVPFVLLDTNNDGVADFEVTARRLPGTDLVQSLTVNIATGAVVSAGPVNFGVGNYWQASAVLLPVAAAAIGMPAGGRPYPVQYTAGLYDLGTQTVTSATAPISVNLAHPPVRVPSPLQDDQDQTVVNYQSSGSTPALIVRLFSADSGAQVLTLPRRRG